MSKIYSILITGALNLFSVSSIFAADESTTLLGFKVNRLGVEYTVYSGGCTEKKDFSIERSNTVPVEITLHRNTLDFCPGHMPYGTDIQFTWDELSVNRYEAFVLTNPISTLHRRN